jgi:class 3 adenylate cyclase
LSGFPRTSAIEWLLRGGASASSPGSLLGGLCDRLVLERMPIAGALLTVASLDPLVASTSRRWQRRDGRVIEEVTLHGRTLGTTSGTTSDDQAGFLLTLPGTKHQIEWFAESPGGFTAEQQAYLENIALMLVAPLQVVVERSVTRNLLQAYLGRRSAEKVLSGTVRRGIGEVIEAVVWISDLRDFSLLSEALPPDQVITALNDCCARLVGAIHPYGGEVLKFIGDGLLAIFPLAAHGENVACDAAIAAVRAARQGMARLDSDRLGAGLQPLPFGIGLHLGAVVYGNIGAADRLDFTAIGTAVNVASRIEGLCRSLACPVLISNAVATRCTTSLAAVGRHALRGIAQPVELFTLPELTRS